MVETREIERVIGAICMFCFCFQVQVTHSPFDYRWGLGQSGTPKQP